MLRTGLNLVLLTLSFAFLASASQAAAGIVFLRTDCTSATDVPSGATCVENVGNLNDHIWGASGVHPTAAAPLVADIGPGEFPGTIKCPDAAGWVAFRGAGREHSRILGVSGGLFSPPAAVSAEECESLSFRDITLVSTAASSFGVYWLGGGSSTWSNVDIIGGAAAWYDTDRFWAPTSCAGSPGGPPHGVHYFFSSRLIGERFGFFAECGESWLYGSEVRVAPSVSNEPLGGYQGLFVSHRGDLRLFGSTVRLLSANEPTATATFVGARIGAQGNLSSGAGTFHMHGGIISIDASNGSEAVGIEADGTNALAHTLDTAFALKPGSVGATRLTGTGNLLSPLLWQSGSDVPVANLGSLTGKDMFVETDCDATRCDAGGTDPHLMIYKADCPGTPWFDVVLGACRQ